MHRVHFPKEFSLMTKTAPHPPEHRHDPQMVQLESDTKRCVLIADDDPDFLLQHSTAFQSLGFDVVTAEHGEQALEILRADEPRVDLVLLDLSMPGLSGERVLRAIRSFKPDLPVIIASGYASVESQTAWYAAGAQGFVAKPYRVQDVAIKLREVLDRAHGRVS